jgi:hypothetical protein
MTASRAARRRQAPGKVTVSTPPHPDQGRQVCHRPDGRTGTITGQLVEHLSFDATFWRCRVFVRPAGSGTEFEADPQDLNLI